MPERRYPMTIAEYKSKNWRFGCSCHLNPPCGCCVDMPCEEEDAEARASAAAEEQKADIWAAVVAIAGGK